MMAGDRDDIATVEHEQVVVEKSLSVSEPNVAKVEFRLDSRADTDLRVTLQDPRPSEWPRDRIGFHPDHEPEMWTIEDETVTYVQKLAAGADHRSLYAVQFENESELEAFERDPLIEVESFPQLAKPQSATEENPGSINGDEDVDTADSAEQTASSSHPETVEEGDGSSGQDAVAASTTKAAVAEFAEPQDINRAVDTGNVDVESPVQDEPATIADENGIETEPDSPSIEPNSSDLLETFLDELENASEGQQQAIADVLDIQPQTSLRSRIEHLEQELTELEAYTGALQEFLDDEGDAQQILDTIQDEQNELADQLDSLSVDVDHLRAEIDDLSKVEQRLDEIESEIEDIPAGLPGKIEALYDELEHLESQHGDRIETLECQLSDELDELDHQFSSDIDELRDDLADYRQTTDDRLDQFEERFRPELESIKTKCLDTLEEVESSQASTHQELERITEELDELAAWQSTMQDTFANLSDSDTDE